MPAMADTSTPQSNPSVPTAELPERLCTWCKVAMTTPLVTSEGVRAEYARVMVFQHTTKRTPAS